MKDIGISKKYKVISLFFNGDTYDEIVDKLGISKGSVSNIINDYRNGELQIPQNYYIDVFRALAVDLRKQNTTVKKLQMYGTLDQKLAVMGVGVDQVEDWLDIVEDIATDPASMKGFVSAALELNQMEMVTGLNCESIFTEYEKTSQELESIKEELANTTELKEKADAELDAVNKGRETAQEQLKKETAKLKDKLDKHVVESKLTWNLVDTVKAILHDKLGIVQEIIDSKITSPVAVVYLLG